MVLSLMRFSGFALNHNPVSLTVTRKRTARITAFPGAGARVSGVSGYCTVVSGKGELNGEDCMSRLSMLQRLFDSGKPGVLSLPGLQPFEAYFTGLTVTGSARENHLEYGFEFTGLSEETAQADPVPERVRAQQGQTLFDLATENGVSVDRLVEQNPGIRRINELVDGQWVRLC